MSQATTATYSLARGGSTGVPNAPATGGGRASSSTARRRKREAVERVSDRFSLIGPTIYHEFVDDRVAAGGALGARRDGIVVAGQSVCDAADHRNPRKGGRRPCLGRRSASSAPGEDGSGGHGSSLGAEGLRGCGRSSRVVVETATGMETASEAPRFRSP